MFVSGIDQDAALDILPALVGGAGKARRSARSTSRSCSTYALYDQPEVVRTIVGFGQSMDELPLMLLDYSLDLVWAPNLRVLADLLGVSVERIEIHVERRPLERAIEVPGMGTFESGTQGAFRFEVRGIVAGRALLVVEHVTRIDDECAPDWPSSASPGGEHRVIIRGRPDIEVGVHSLDPGEPGPAAGGNAAGPTAS